MKTREIMSNQRIEQRLATIEKHSLMTCRSFTFKIDYNHLSNEQRRKLKQQFREGKYCYNHYLALRLEGKKWSEIDTKETVVPVLTPDGYDDRSVASVPAQARQELKRRIMTSEQSMKTNVARGNNNKSSMHFIRKLESIPLKQYGVSHKIIPDKNKIQLTGLGQVPVHGLKQVESIKEIEFANGSLIQNALGYFVQIITYTPTNDDIEFLADFIGIDFGVSATITTSDGEVLDFYFGETERLKEAQRKNQEYRDNTEKKFGKAQNSNKQLKIMKQEYAILNNRKDDSANKVVHYLLSTYRYIVIQDESVAEWKKTYGSKVHHSILGRVIKKLKEHKDRVIIVDKYMRTTGVCSNCGATTPEVLSLEVREWTCPECGMVHHRDGCSAEVIKLIGVGELTTHIVDVMPREVLELSRAIPF